jgi:hypothetical protein
MQRLFRCTHSKSPPERVVLTGHPPYTCVQRVRVELVVDPQKMKRYRQMETERQVAEEAAAAAAVRAALRLACSVPLAARCRLECAYGAPSTSGQGAGGHSQATTPTK